MTKVQGLAGFVAGMFCLPAAWVPAVFAQASYPDRPIRVIVPFAPGGGSDVTARFVGARLFERFGQPVVVDNRTGASGNIAAEMVARSAPDGYTLFSVFSSHAQGAQLFTKLAYDIVRDFAPISMVSETPPVLVTHPSVPAKSVKELIAYAKENPGKLNYGTSGPGTPPHLETELFNSMAGIRMTHVPYKGSGQYIMAQLANEIQVSFTSIVTIIPHSKTGRLRLLASGGTKRSQVIPDTPTIAEAGLPGYEAYIWYGFMAPAKTPRPIVDKLHKEIAAIARSPEARQTFIAQGNDPVGNTPEEFAAFIKLEAEKWGAIGKRLGIKLE